MRDSREGRDEKARERIVFPRGEPAGKAGVSTGSAFAGSGPGGARPRDPAKPADAPGADLEGPWG